MQLFGLFTVASSGHLSFREEKRQATVRLVLLREDRNLPGLLSSAPVAAGDTLVRSWSLSGPISNPHPRAGAKGSTARAAGPCPGHAPNFPNLWAPNCGTERTRHPNPLQPAASQRGAWQRSLEEKTPRRGQRGEP